MTGYATEQQVSPRWIAPLCILTGLVLLAVCCFEWKGVLGIVGIMAFALITWHVPEFWIALLFSSGIFKEWATLSIPLFRAVDFTVALSALAALAGFLHWVRQPRGMGFAHWASLLTFAALASYLLLSVSWSPAPKYGLSKALSFAGFGGVLFLTTSALGHPKAVLRSLWILFALAVGTSIYTLVTLVRSVGNLPKILEFYRASFLGVNPISYAQWAGAVAVASLAIAPVVRTRWRRVLAYLGSAILVIVVLAANSRGPMLCLVLTVAVLVLAEARRSRSYRALAWMTGAVIVFLLAISLLPKQLVSRYSDFSEERGGFYAVGSRLTVYQRLRAWESAVDVSLAEPTTMAFGLGCGGFAHAYYHADVQWWPHNIFLEVLSEGGIVGLLLLAGHWGTFLLLGRRRGAGIRPTDESRRRIYLALGLALLFLFIGAQFSGDLSHNRRLWYFLGLLNAANSEAERSE